MRGKRLVVGFILASLALTLVVGAPGCKKSSYDIAHLGESPRYDTGYTIDTPAPIRTTVEKTIDLSILLGEDMPYEASMHRVEVSVRDVWRGDKAWDLLKDVEGTVPAPEGYDYIVAKIKIDLYAEASSTRWFELYEYALSLHDLVAYSADGTRYQYSTIPPPPPKMIYTWVAGEKKEGYAVFTVARDDATPRMCVVRDLLWFQLYK
jgi:hypothetical protein